MVAAVGGFVEASVNVMFVVSDEDIRLLLRLTMRADPRLRVTGEAASAVVGLELLDTAEPALIVIDRHLDGDLTCIAAAAHLKARAPMAKILLLTAFESDREAEASTAIDCSLRKSEMHRFLDTVRHLLGLPLGP